MYFIYIYGRLELPELSSHHLAIASSLGDNLPSSFFRRFPHLLSAPMLLGITGRLVEDLQASSFPVFSWFPVVLKLSGRLAEGLRRVASSRTVFSWSSSQVSFRARRPNSCGSKVGCEVILFLVFPFPSELEFENGTPKACARQTPE